MNMMIAIFIILIVITVALGLYACCVVSKQSDERIYEDDENENND